MDRKNYYVDKKIEYFTYNNAVILPQKDVENGPMWGLGGICDESGAFIDKSFYDGGWATHGGRYDWNKADESYEDSCVIYMGMFFLHWGHFLVDLVGRLWFPALSEMYRQDMKIAYLGDQIPTGNFLEFFELLGVKEEQLIQIKRPTRFKQVIIPENACKSCDWYSDTFVKMFDHIVQKALKDEKSDTLPRTIEKVYFTRQNLGKAKVSECGESLIASCMEANGFQLISPEKQSLHEQIHIWTHAKEIACFNGTIPLNIIFSGKNKLNLIVFNKTSILHENLLVFLQMKHTKSQLIDIYKEPFKKYPKSLGAGPFLVTITPSLKKYMNTNGMNCPISYWKLKWYDSINFFKYCYLITGIQTKCRLLLSRIIPHKIKGFLRR